MLTDSKYLQLRKGKAILVKDILDEVILDVCCRENCFLIANFINIFSFDLIAEGARPKPYYITQKTEKDGISAGFILQQSNDSNKHNNFEYRIIDIQPDIKKNVLYNNGDLVTSDFDIVLTARIPTYGDPNIYFDFEMGYICQSDMQTFNSINEEFKQKLFSLIGQKIQHNIIQHGALNYCPSINEYDLNFPMSIYTPKKTKHDIGLKKSAKENMISFLDLCHSLKNSGYDIRLHENWICPDIFC